MRLREAHEKEAPLGFARVTKATVILAGQRKKIHALAKIKHGGSYIWWSLHPSSICLLLCSGPRFIMVPNDMC